MSRLWDMWLMGLREPPEESHGEPRHEHWTSRVHQTKCHTQAPDPPITERENPAILGSRLIAVTLTSN